MDRGEPSPQRHKAHKDGIDGSYPLAVSLLLCPWCLCGAAGSWVAPVGDVEPSHSGRQPGRLLGRCPMAAIVKKHEGSPDPDAFRKMLGPGHVAQSVGQAIQACWMMLPEKRKTLDDLEKEFRRLVDR